MIRRMLCRLGWHAWTRTYSPVMHHPQWECVDCHQTRALTRDELEAAR